MNREEVVRVLAVLQTAYPMFYRGQNPQQARDTVNLWVSMFGDKDYELVMSAVKSLIATRTETYPPNIGAVNEMIQKLTAPEMTPVEAWGYVRRALRNGAYGAEDEWARLPEMVQRAITPDQIRAWATDDEFNEGVASSNFMRSYLAKNKSVREERMMPAEIQKMLQQKTQRLLGE